MQTRIVIVILNSLVHAHRLALIVSVSGKARERTIRSISKGQKYSEQLRRVRIGSIARDYTYNKTTFLYQDYAVVGSTKGASS